MVTRTELHSGHLIRTSDPFSTCTHLIPKTQGFAPYALPRFSISNENDMNVESYEDGDDGEDFDGETKLTCPREPITSLMLSHGVFSPVQPRRRHHAGVQSKRSGRRTFIDQDTVIPSAAGTIEWVPTALRPCSYAPSISLRSVMHAFIYCTVRARLPVPPHLNTQFLSYYFGWWRVSLSRPQYDFAGCLKEGAFYNAIWRRLLPETRFALLVGVRLLEAYPL